MFDTPEMVKFRLIAKDSPPSCEAVRRGLQCTPEHQRKEFEHFCDATPKAGFGVVIDTEATRSIEAHALYTPTVLRSCRKDLMGIIGPFPYLSWVLSNKAG